MGVYESINEMLHRYGNSVTVSENGNTRTSKAIIQPLMYKNKMYLGGSHFPLGYFDAGHYLMIAPVDMGITDYRNALITDRGVIYKIKRCEAVSADNRDVYLWSVLTLVSSEVEDDYENAQ